MESLQNTSKRKGYNMKINVKEENIDINELKSGLKLNALVIDDDKTLLTVIESMLNKLDIKCDKCQSSIEFENALKNINYYDLILTDREMGAFSGLDVLKKVKEIGYDYVEMAGYFGKSAEEIRAILDKYDLKCISVHQGLDFYDEKGVEGAEFVKTLGAEFSVVPWYNKEELYTNMEGTIKKIEDLTDSEINALLEEKWILPLCTSLQPLMSLHYLLLPLE